ncbi:sensor histidine kinase [Herbiconiux daphne]|uniref:ATP-binding protein n=1 Tax=Herbiconiux daphne TaxID=2970914 RepID=A0ABT2H4L2_9MICO|nr:ATP-binding protein [Herbiconiux daphne]MCS5734854.1 ATP-binding protein [Herbiconiux daphne]
MSNSPGPTSARGSFWTGPAASGAANSRAPLSRAQIDTTLARLEGLFGFVFALISIPALGQSAHTLKPEWAWGVTIAVFGSIAVAFVCSLVGRGIRVSMAVVACVFVVALVLWPLAVVTPAAAMGTQPWLWYIMIVAIAAAGISFPTLWAGVYAVGVPVIFAVLRVLPAGGGVSWPLAILDAMYTLLLGSFVVVVITVLRNAASRVDEAQATAVGRYADAAKRHAAEQERTRVDTVIHDRVLSTLLAASRSRSAADRHVAVQMAERALVALQSADAESEGAADLPIAVLVERSRALADTLSAPIAFSTEGDLAGSVPARVIEGVYSATVQAIVNSIQHAGAADVARTISLHGRGSSGFTVVVADTGAGFDVDGVPADRLGVRISIRERVASVGGEADLRSVPGSGTSVVLSWPAEGVPAFASAAPEPMAAPRPEPEAGPDPEGPAAAGSEPAVPGDTAPGPEGPGATGSEQAVSGGPAPGPEATAHERASWNGPVPEAKVAAPTGPKSTGSEPSGPEPTRPEATAAEPTAPEPTASEPTDPEPTDAANAGPHATRPGPPARDAEGER